MLINIKYSPKRFPPTIPIRFARFLPFSFIVTNRCVFKTAEREKKKRLDLAQLACTVAPPAENAATSNSFQIGGAEFVVCRCRSENRIVLVLRNERKCRKPVPSDGQQRRNRESTVRVRIRTVLKVSVCGCPFARSKGGFLARAIILRLCVIIWPQQQQQRAQQQCAEESGQSGRQKVVIVIGVGKLCLLENGVCENQARVLPEGS